ncbi:MAG: hypothetical protein SFZ23_12180 [Planctomycetota bacterium]|nr:hypothetical protein [Planctomycetota bacterium]
MHLPPPTLGLRIRPLTDDEHALAWVARLPELLTTFAAATPRALKQGARGSVWRARLGPKGRTRDVVLKCRPVRGLGQRLRVALRWSSLDREALGAEMLVAARIPTAQPLALVTGQSVIAAASREDRVRSQCLISMALPGKSLLEHLRDRDLSLVDERHLCAEAGRLVAHFTALGLFNRDHKPSNLMVVPPTGQGSGSPSGSQPDRAPGLALAVIDPRGVARGKRPRQMLASLMIEPLGVRCPPRRAVRARVLHAYVSETILGVQASALSDAESSSSPTEAFYRSLTSSDDQSREADSPVSEAGAQGSDEASTATPRIEPLPPAIERAAVKDLWRAIDAAIAAHGDPRPKDSPFPAGDGVNAGAGT